MKNSYLIAFLLLFLSSHSSASSSEDLTIFKAKEIVTLDQTISSADSVLVNNDRVIAIGETGLDYFHVKKDQADWQRDRFKRHIAASNDSGKPMIIHMRDSKDDTIEILSSERAKKGVMHCFAEDLETAKAALDLGFYISFSGIITFKSAQDLREVAKQIPSDRILIETDSPYLTPVPYRGKPNSPAYTYYVAEKLAEIRNSSVAEIARVTTQNFNQLFFS